MRPAVAGGGWLACWLAGWHRWCETMAAKWRRGCPVKCNLYRRKLA